MSILQYKRIASLLAGTATMLLISMNTHADTRNDHLDKQAQNLNYHQAYQYASIDYLTLSHDGTEFYGIHGSFTGENSVYVIDASTGITTKKIKLPDVIGNHNTYGPFNMIMSPDGKMLYIVASTEIIKIDAIKKEIAAVISTGKNSSDRSIDISSDGLKVVSADYADYGGNNETYIHVVDTQKNILSNAIPKGSNPGLYRSGFGNLAVSKLTNKVYLVDNDSIAVFDMHTKKLQLNAIPLTSRASIGSMAIDSSRELLYVNEPDKNVLDVIDLKAEKIIEQIHVGDYPDAISLSPNGSKVYIGFAKSASITVVDTKTHSIIKTINIPYKSSSKFQISSNGKQLYLIIKERVFGDAWSNVLILDADTGEKIKYFPVNGI